MCCPSNMLIIDKGKVQGEQSFIYIKGSVFQGYGYFKLNHHGLYEENPRSREIVYILIAQRAARGLGSLYAHANMMSMEEAGKIHSEYTPRGWMKTEKELLIFEQHLYLRQPGYGTSYITGKYLLEKAMTEVALGKEKKGEDFSLKSFFDTLNRIGNIPISLGEWEMTGKAAAVLELVENFEPLVVDVN